MLACIAGPKPNCCSTRRFKVGTDAAELFCNPRPGLTVVLLTHCSMLTAPPAHATSGLTARLSLGPWSGSPAAGFHSRFAVRLHRKGSSAHQSQLHDRGCLPAEVIYHAARWALETLLLLWALPHVSQRHSFPQICARALKSVHELYGRSTMLCCQCCCILLKLLKKLLKVLGLLEPAAASANTLKDRMGLNNEPGWLLGL